MLVVVYHAYFSWHSEAYSSDNAPSVRAESVTGIARRTSCYLFVFSDGQERTSSIPGGYGATAIAAAAAFVLALLGELDLALAERAKNAS